MLISTCGFWGFSGGHLGRRDWIFWPLQVHRKRSWAQSCFKGPPENPQKWYAEINQILRVVSGGFLGVTRAAASGFLGRLRSTRNVFGHKVAPGDPQKTPRKGTLKLVEFCALFLGVFWGLFGSMRKAFVTVYRSKRNFFALCRGGIRALCRRHAWYCTHTLTKP